MDRQVASRYAEALFALAQARNEVEQVDADLKAAAQLLAELPDFARLLRHPEIPEARKFQLLDRAFADALLPTAQSFLKLLVKRRRSELLAMVQEEYRLRADAAEGLERVQVTAAAPLTPEQGQRLQQTLERLTGKQVLMELRVDLGLLAGAKVEIEHRLIDGSAAGRLEAMRSRLKEAGRI